ncbi:MAG: HAD family hydrolase [Candidatus Nanosalina sp.]
MVLSESETGERAQQEVRFLIDNCNTAYLPGQGYGDVGKNISLHPRSRVAGFEGPEDFDEKMARVAERDDVSHSSQLVWWLANRSNTDDIDELEEIAVEAQHPEDYPEGFRHFNEYMSDVPRDMVTAAWERPVERVVGDRLGEYAPSVIGGKLHQNGAGIEIDEFCGGEEKADRVEQIHDVDVEEEPVIAYGNSMGDAPIMEPAEEAIGRGDAYEISTIYTHEDHDFWTRGVLGVGAYELASGGNPRDAEERMWDFLEEGALKYGGFELETVERGGAAPGEYTDDLTEAYENILEEAGSW